MYYVPALAKPQATPVAARPRGRSAAMEGDSAGVRSAISSDEDGGFIIRQRAHRVIGEKEIYGIEFFSSEPWQGFEAESDEALVRAGAIHLLAGGIRQASAQNCHQKLIFKIPCASLEDDFVLDAFQLLRHIYRIGAERFVVKTGEAVFAENATRARRGLDRLRSEGVGVVVDDLGVGPSPLPFLHVGAFAGVSMDASFIRDLLKADPAAVAICGLLRVLAKEFQFMLFANVSLDPKRRAIISQHGFHVALDSGDIRSDAGSYCCQLS